MKWLIVIRYISFISLGLSFILLFFNIVMFFYILLNRLGKIEPDEFNVVNLFSIGLMLFAIALNQINKNR